MAASIMLGRKFCGISMVSTLIPRILAWKRNIRVGERLPPVSLYVDLPSNPINLQELFKGKKGVVFSVIGAFVPGCSQAHLPEYINHVDKFREEGYDLLGCIAVNDPFVMSAWGKSVGADGKVLMLADPKAEFTRALDMELDCKNLLGGVRSKRYSLVIEDGIVQGVNTEPDHTGLACLLCIRNYVRTRVAQ
ncbi:hypothetical protein ACJMK2_037250 [Sinanodonta woodiana]|uniref:Peroxiredoxin-5 n=1 Tax=Sinanodonta woodiana TaxID=1069815 RepID=A0ABD3WJP3_SINWO